MVAARGGSQLLLGVRPARYPGGAEPDGDVNKCMLVADAADHADHSGGSPAWLRVPVAGVQQTLSMYG
jgi:hypothetical protein